MVGDIKICLFLCCIKNVLNPIFKNFQVPTILNSTKWIVRTMFWFHIGIVNKDKSINSLYGLYYNVIYYVINYYILLYTSRTVQKVMHIYFYFHIGTYV